MVAPQQSLSIHRCFICFKPTDCPRITLYHVKLNDRIALCSDPCLKSYLDPNVGKNTFKIIHIQLDPLRPNVKVDKICPSSKK